MWKQATWTADEVSEGRLLVEVALAGVEAREEDYVAAERRYRNALERRPQAIPALEGLGRLLMQFGRIDEAVALFETGQGARPDARPRRTDQRTPFSGGRGTLQRLEQFARTPGMEGSRADRHAVSSSPRPGKSREDYDKAFALADEANAAGRKALHYDPKAHRQYCARSAPRFSEGAVRDTVPVAAFAKPRYRCS